MISHADDIRCHIKSGGWHDEIFSKSSGWLSSKWYLIRMVDGLGLVPYVRMSCGWHMKATEVTLMTYGLCRTSSDGLWCYHKLSGWQRNLNPMSSGRLSSWRYLIRMTYGIMQYLIRMTYDATLNHLDDKTTFDWVFRILANPTLSLGHG